MAQHHIWLLKLLRTTGLETSGGAQQKMGIYLKIYQRRAEATIMEGHISCAELGLQNYSLTLLGPHSRKVRLNFTKSITKYILFKEKEGENALPTQGKSQCNIMSSLVAKTDDQESRYHLTASP